MLSIHSNDHNVWLAKRLRSHRGACCSCKGAKFHFKRPCWSPMTTIQGESNAFFWLPRAPELMHMWPQTEMHTHIYNIFLIYRNSIHYFGVYSLLESSKLYFFINIYEERLFSTSDRSSLEAIPNPTTRMLWPSSFWSQFPQYWWSQGINCCFLDTKTCAVST